MDATRTVPAAALRFDAAPMAFADAERDAPRRFDGVAYSGEAIRNHFYWGTVVFDLATTRAPERTPILIEHDRSQRCGVGRLHIGADAIRIDGTLLDNAHGRSIAEEAAAGFPWQLSVHIQPGRIEEVADGVAVSVNGRDLTGPITVFRDSLIRETSFTPTGADPDTSARVFADAAELEIPVTTNEGHDMSDDTTARIAALEEQLATAQNAIRTANERADAAEAALSEMRASARTEQVKSLFSAIGRAFTEADAAPFLSMTDEQFAATDSVLRESAPKHSPHLFSDQATNGATPGAPALDPETIYAARQPGGKE